MRPLFGWAHAGVRGLEVLPMIHAYSTTSLLRGAKRISLCLGLVAPVGVLWACTEGDDAVSAPDAGAVEASSNDQVSPPSDGGTAGLACGDATGVPARVLVVQNKPKGSELAAVNLATKTVDGRLEFAGGYGTTSSLGTDPYLLGGESDIVTRLDAREPWKAVASWNVRGDDGVDGGLENANPVAVVQTACNKAYVLRFNRDRIAIIDPSQAAGGVPTGYVDLAPLKQAGDPSEVEMTGAVYVPSKKRVYVLLGNADLSRFVTANGSTKLVCADLAPTVIAIDTETDKVVNLGGTGPGGGIALGGYNPPLGTPLVYDAVLDRLLVLNAGCNADLGDGGAGAMTRRRVEQVDLATGAVKTLLSLDDRGFPSSLAFASGEKAALAFFFDGYRWDPRETTLGAEIQGGIDLVASDGRGAFVGSRQVYFDDGGSGPLQVLEVPGSDAGPSVVAEDPFTKAGGYVGIEAWPHP